MREGELQKRLSRHKQPSDFYGNDILFEYNVRHWVEEMKKEFPPYAQKILNKPRYSGGWTLEDLREWFERWLGE